MLLSPKRLVEESTGELPNSKARMATILLDTISNRVEFGPDRCG
jgi:hypothetical protein